MKKRSKKGQKRRYNFNLVHWNFEDNSKRSHKIAKKEVAIDT